MPGHPRAIPPEFDAIRSEAGLRAFVERYGLKALRANTSRVLTLGEWSGAIDGRLVFVSSRRIGNAQEVRLTLGTADGGPLLQRMLRFGAA